ncbi:MAG TPA: flagellar basal body rod protein FlgB [bacterium]|nr:flagellar basal body rod protein FlgB [bacterium]
MLEQFYGDISYVAVRKGLDTSTVRQKVYANNIANVDTPHYKRSEVNFEDAFKMAIAKAPKRLSGFRTDYGHIPINPPTDINSVKPTIWRENDTYTRADDNNVDMDVEMAEVAKNEVMFNALVEVLSKKMAGLKNAITGKVG